MNQINAVQLFHGELTPTSARVYARLNEIENNMNLSLGGHVEGPFRDDAHTLPATVPLRPSPPGDSLLAEAVLPDPCFWSPDTPATYRVKIELRRNMQLIGHQWRILGLRGLGIFGPSVFRNGKRWVLRGVQSLNNSQIVWEDWHAMAAMMVVNQIDERLCSEASRHGVPLAVLVRPGEKDIITKLYQLAHWPAISLVVFPNCDHVEIDQWRQRCPNVLVGSHFHGRNSETIPTSVHLILCEENSIQPLTTTPDQCDSPILVIRTLPAGFDLARARTECDILQRDLARIGDFSGYFIMEKES